LVFKLFIFIVTIQIVDDNDFVKIVKILETIYSETGRRAEPFEILIHGIMSTRTKDTTTFPAQKRLLLIANTPEKISKMSVGRIEKLIYPVGFYKTKAKLLKKACKFIIKNFDSNVPSNKNDLMEIPGVGPKVASLVLEWGFGMPYIAVDTHVNRVAQRIGLVPFGTKPEKTEEVMENILDDSTKIGVNTTLIKFGRTICKPISPVCNNCPVYDYCGFKLKKKYYKL
jgi:endonuclease-3